MKKRRIRISLLFMSVAFFVFALVHSRYLTGKDVKKTICVITGSIGEKNPSGRGDKIVAVVDNEPIYEKDISAGMPPPSFGGIDEYAREKKLNRLIYEAKLRHFLKEKKIEVAACDVDKSIEDYKKTPPSSGCPFCSFGTLEQYLQANNFTMDEFREMVRVQNGLDAYLDGLWVQKYPVKDALLNIAKDRQSELKTKYIQLFQITFMTKNPNVSNDSKELSDLYNKANLAWQRLEKGESFAKVAKEMSDDKASAVNGGFVGIQPLEALWGAAYGKELRSLSFGTYSRPIAVPYGYLIIKKEKLTDDSTMATLKQEFLSEKCNEVLTAIDANSTVKIEK